MGVSQIPVRSHNKDLLPLMAVFGAVYGWVLALVALVVSLAVVIIR